MYKIFSHGEIFLRIKISTFSNINISSAICQSTRNGNGGGGAGVEE